MKRERMKGFVAGLLVAVMALGLIGTAAATIGKRAVEVDYTDIKIELNGKKVTPVDANGNAVEPFAINGTTYLPVRAVSNALGLDVGWDGATSTVKLTGKPDFREVYSQMLTTMDEYKWIEDEADRGKELSSILSREAFSVFPKDDIAAYLSKTLDGSVAKYGNNLEEDLATVKLLLLTCKTDYLRDCLENAASCYETLQTGQSNLSLAYVYGIAYVNNPTTENYNLYSDFRRKADDCFNTVLDGSKYYELRDTLKAMLEL